MFFNWCKSRKEIFLSLVLKGLRLFFEELVDDVWEVVGKQVSIAEKTNEDGAMKYKIAYNGIIQELGEVNYPTYLVNLLIEVAVVLMKEQEYK